MHDAHSISKLKKHYQHLLNSSEASYTFFAPGRVNLIGEYTDFNGGLVLPCALQYGTYLLLQKRPDSLFTFHSINCPETPSISLKQVKDLKSKHSSYAWANYPLGILKQFENHLSTGFDFFYYGNIPLGSGLSSSASIELVTAFALNTLFNSQLSLTELSLTELAQLCQRAENQFIGVQCGIMDMYSIAHGQANKAMLIDCKNITHTYVPLEMEQFSWLIINSNKKRQLSESKYNERNQECQSALAILNKTRKLQYLCQLPASELAQAKTEIHDEIIYQRLHHVVSEHQRVIDCELALRNKEWGKVADFMNASHNSLSKNFEVSGETLDKLVNISRNTQGVIGSRMTGAGFGGCTINLIESNQQENIIKTIQEKYYSATGLKADVYLAQASQGVRQIMQEIK